MAQCKGISYIGLSIREDALNNEAIALLDPSDSMIHQKCVLLRSTASDAEYTLSLDLPKKMLTDIVVYAIVKLNR